MIALEDLTLVIALDAEHLAEFKSVWPTWIKYHPELKPMLKIFMCDGKAMAPSEWERSLKPMSRNATIDTVQLTNNPGDQREAMLGLFVQRAPGLVETSHWLKIDTDAVCTGPGKLCDPDWFVDDPAIVAPGWNYTKPRQFIIRLDRWAEEAHGLAHYHRPVIASDCEITIRNGIERIHHPRITSWISIIETDFSRQAARFAARCLPVPSQDTYHWYVAARLKRTIVRSKAIRNGWVHCSGRKRRERVVQEVMGK